MGVDFYPAIVENPGTANESSRPAIRCACDIASDGYECAACRAKLSLACENARDLLAYLGILDALEVRHPSIERGVDIAGNEHSGHIRGNLLAQLCRARLGMHCVETDRAAIMLGRVSIAARTADYLPRRTRELLVVATLARGGWVVWS